jgi:hypothetical protein
MRKTAANELEENTKLDMLNDTIEALWEGARGSGVTLTKGECLLLLHTLPAVRSQGYSWWELIAQYSFYQEGDGVEAAVEATKQKFKVSRQTVFDARRQWNEYFALLRSRCKSD